MSDKTEEKQYDKIEYCPHCGEQLSPWQQVLLNIDRAVMCKHCWYRILLTGPEEDANENTEQTKDED